MKTLGVVLTLVATLAVPVNARAAVVDANMIPDGRYLVKVERVDDAHHILVLMDNGVESTLAGPSVDFSKLKPNDMVSVAIIKGVVPVFAPA